MPRPGGQMYADALAECGACWAVGDEADAAVTRHRVLVGDDVQPRDALRLGEPSIFGHARTGERDDGAVRQRRDAGAAAADELRIEQEELRVREERVAVAGFDNDARR